MMLRIILYNTITQVRLDVFSDVYIKLIISECRYGINVFSRPTEKR